MGFWKRLVRLFKGDADAHNAVKDGNSGHIFKIGETGRLKEYLINQIKSANKWVLIIDPYIGEKYWKHIEIAMTRKYIEDNFPPYNSYL